MSTDQVQYLISVVEKMREDISDMRTQIAVQNEQIQGLLEDRRLFKKPIVAILIGLAAIVAGAATWLSAKLGFPAS